MIVLTGGKTGGHIIPLIAIAKSIDNPYYIGSSNSLEERLCRENNISFLGLNMQKNSIFNALGCLLKLKLKNVDMVISTGGYVAFPTLLYAIIHRIPIYLLEENVIIGKTNQFFSFFAKKIFLAYPLKKMKRKYVIAGIPLIKTDSNINLNFSIDVLIIGGSLGSKPLCDLAIDLADDYNVTLIAGKYYNEYKNNNKMIVYDYFFNLRELMSKSKLVISRAGAVTTYEVFNENIPCIVIPSQNTKKNHQYLNALYFEKNGCAKLFKEKELQGIKGYIDYILGNKEYQKEMLKKQRQLVKTDSINIIRSEIGI